jgi:hypothetical protein
MRNLIVYLALALCLFVTKMTAQDSSQNGEQPKQTFESKAKVIANKIEKITKEEKETLKTEIESVNKELESGTITKEQADDKKQKLAQARATMIETRVAPVQEELKDLVQQKVNGKIAEGKSTDSTTVKLGKRLVLRFENDSIKNKKWEHKEKRTTTQFVFAAGLNNLVTNGTVANSDFRYWGSHFYEWGVTANTRLFKNDNLLHLKYGFSVMYNNLRPTDNRTFVVNGNQTNLETYAYPLNESRLRNVYVSLPLHVEFDFTKAKMKDGVKIFRTHESVRLGIGGYVGIKVKSKQKIEYDRNGEDIYEKALGSFNVNDFIYGVSTYLGYKGTSLYLKYDLNPLFKDNLVKQNNVSLGIRFDLN